MFKIRRKKESFISRIKKNEINYKFSDDDDDDDEYTFLVLL